MSYILDALVKADQERQRQGLPGLNTVQVSPFPRAGSRLAWPLWAAGAGVLAGALVLAWGFLERERTPPVVPVAQVASAPAAPPAALAAPVREPVRAPEAKAEKSGGEAAGPRSPAPRREPAAAPGPGRTDEPMAKPGSRLHALAELPPALRKEAEKITVAGFAQAGGADGRLAIINNRALREGDEVTTGLRVERIAEDGVIFNLRGYRFSKGGF